MGVTSAHVNTRRRRGPLLDRFRTHFVSGGLEHRHLQQLVDFPIVLDVEVLGLVLMLVLGAASSAVRNRAQPNACV